MLIHKFFVFGLTKLIDKNEYSMPIIVYYAKIFSNLVKILLYNRKILS